MEQIRYEKREDFDLLNPIVKDGLYFVRKLGSRIVKIRETFHDTKDIKILKTYEEYDENDRKQGIWVEFFADGTLKRYDNYWNDELANVITGSVYDLLI